LINQEEYPAFLGSELGPQSPESSLFHVIPVPYEKTVSYVKGTGKAPSAILKASWQLELFDGRGIPAEKGIFTHRAIDCEGDAVKVLAAIEGQIGELFYSGKIPVMIGGEHTITLAAARALKEIHSEAGIIQFDAHADLRDSYEGDALSHACVMRRISELGIPIVQAGVRSLCLEEHEYRRRKGIQCLDPYGLFDSSPPSAWIPTGFPPKVYVTIDIDALDSSIMPATGTPEPGGLSWRMLLSLLSYLTSQREVVGFDLVELSPVTGLHACDYAAAKLIYLFMGMIAGGS
jgi:agmatinase